MLAWSDWVIARNPDVWGPDCCEFNPYRFIETTKKADGTSERSIKSYGQWKYHVFKRRTSPLSWHDAGKLRGNQYGRCRA